MKLRTLSLKERSKTKFFSILFFIIGIILIVTFFLLQLLGLQREGGIVLAFVILFLGAAGILYFFHRQLMKLAQACEEFENEEEPQP
jgi:quinol-cytochrome oxidoreductase complex cytochrome b subunit